MTSRGSVTLSAANLPAHVHTLSTSATGVVVTATAGNLALSLGGLTTTTNLGGVVVSGAASGLKLYGAGNNGTLGDPTGNSLGMATLGAGKIYTATSTPKVAMNNDSIGGNLSLTIASGTTAQGTVGGTSTLSGAPSVTIKGQTDVAGATSPAPATALVPTMMPYLVLNYYIAMQGIYPMYD